MQTTRHAALPTGAAISALARQVRQSLRIVDVLEYDGRGLNLLDGLLFGGHDALQAGVAGLVEPLLRGDHRRQGAFHDLTAAFDLALGPEGALAEIELHDDAGLGHAEQFGEHWPHGGVVASNSLVAAEDQVEALVLGVGGDHLGHGEGFTLAITLQQNGGIRAERQRVLEHILDGIATHGEGNHFGAFAFLDADGLFQRVLIVRTGDPFHIRGIEGSAIGGNLDFGLGVGYLFEGDENFHG